MKNCLQTCATFSNTLSFRLSRWPTRQLIVRRKQLIFFRLKHQLSSRQHSGCLTARTWIRLIIKSGSGRYFRSTCILQGEGKQCWWAAPAYIQTDWDELDQRITGTVVTMTSKVNGNKKAVLPQGNRAMLQVFFSVEVRQQHSLQV